MTVLATALAAWADDSARVTNSSDLITVPDGTPLVLCLKNALSSATAMVGDSVEFSVCSPVVVEELLLVRQGTTLSGAVTRVRHRRRFGRDGEVTVGMQDLVLRDGKIVSVRQTLKSEKTKGKTALAVERAAVESIPTFGLMLPMSALIKGEEKTYPAASVITVYINGPISLDRSVWAALPYKGQAQVFFRNADGDPVHLFRGTDLIGEWSDFLLVEVRPGRYSFSTDKAGDPIQLDLHDDQQYWVERVRGTLTVDDVQKHTDEIKKLLNNPDIAIRDISAISK